MRDHTLPLPTWFLQVVFRVEAAAGVAVIHSERVGGATEAVGVAAFNFLSSCSARFCVCKRAFWQNGMDVFEKQLIYLRPAAAISWVGIVSHAACKHVAKQG